METRNKWNRVFKSLIDPMTIIPIVFGVFFAFLTFYISDEIQTLFTVISAIGLGIGINYFTFYYKEEKAKDILHFKAEHTVRSIDLIIKTILRRTEKVSVENRNTIDFWKDYYSKADTSQIETLKTLRKEIEAENDTKEKTVKQNELLRLERDASTSGLTTYIPLSGGTMNYL
jgi:cell division protein FtsI/penicillin-binding protein 2